MIVRVSNSWLEFDMDRRKKKYPSYSSKAKKTPADYGLKKDDPTIYLGLSSPEVKKTCSIFKRFYYTYGGKDIEVNETEWDSSTFIGRNKARSNTIVYTAHIPNFI